jgi:ABC-type glutathione transport system ATPase component
MLQIKNLQIDFETEQGRHTAVHDISFDVNPGEIVAVVGESGSGKSVTALAILQLLPEKSVRYTKGHIFFSSEDQAPVDLLKTSAGQLRSFRNP